MSYLIDTNVISETSRNKPSQTVQRWLEEIPSDQLYLSVLSLGEIRKGIEKLSAGNKKTQLITWLDQTLPNWFEHRLLPIDQAVAQRWGVLLATAGRPLPAIDSLLAATALTFNLTMVTRNIDDFTMPGLNIINPWTD